MGLPLLSILLVRAHIDIFAELEDNSVSVSRLPPSPLLPLSSSSCDCNKVLVSSLGPAATYQPGVMGVYTRSYTTYNGRASYRQNYGADYRLYWLPTGWMIGNSRGSPTGYIHNPDQTKTCVYQLPAGWLYYSSIHGSWYGDTSLVLRCVPANP